MFNHLEIVPEVNLRAESVEEKSDNPENCGFVKEIKVSKKFSDFKSEDLDIDTDAILERSKSMAPPLRKRAKAQSPSKHYQRKISKLRDTDEGDLLRKLIELKNTTPLLERESVRLDSMLSSYPSNRSCVS